MRRSRAVTHSKTRRYMCRHYWMGYPSHLNEMADGKYTVYWYDPQTANWLPKADVSAVGNVLTIPIPSFRSDLAAKIVRNP